MPYIGNVLTSFAVETGNINDQAITSPKLSATGGTDGQVLALDSNGDLVWSSDPAGQWVTSGNDIFYTTGNVGIGVNSPGHKLDLVDNTAPPLRITRDQQISQGSGLILRQPDTTDGNDLRILYQSDTTGTGASSDVFFAGLEFTAATHDQDTRAGEIGFYTAQGGTGFIDRMRIRSDGTVRIGGSTLAGIGTKVQVHDGADNRNILGVTGADVSSEYIALGIISGDPTITAGNAGSGDTALRFDVASSGTESEAMRINSSGHLVIGAAAGPQTSAQSILQLVHAEGPNLTFSRNDTTTTTNEDIGLIRFYGNDSDGNYDECARIAVEAESEHSSTSKPTYMRFFTNSGTEAVAERMRITSSGRIGIGENDPQATVQIAQDSGLDGVRISVANTSGVSNVFRIRNQGDTSTFGMIKYDIDANRMIFNRGGDVAGFTSDGLTFGADTAAANALDDYEEGTFADPEIVPQNGSFSSVTYHADTAAKYIKIGQIVHYWGTVRWTAFSVGTGSGTLRITAPLQVAARDNGDDSDNVGATIVPVWGGTSTKVPTTIQAQNNQSRCILRATRYDAVSVVVLASDVGTTGMIAFSITYRTP